MGHVLKYCLSLPQIAAELCSSYEEGVGQPMILRVGSTTHVAFFPPEVYKNLLYLGGATPLRRSMQPFPHS